MLEVNGVKFGTPEEAIAYLEGMKKESEEKQKKDLINKRINVVLVEDGDRNVIVCSLSSDENKAMYPYAMTEHIFGKRYKISNGFVSERYKVTALGVTHPLHVAMRRFLRENHNLNDIHQNWQDVEFKENPETLYKILLTDFDLLQETRKMENEKPPTIGDLFKLLFE